MNYFSIPGIKFHHNIIFNIASEVIIDVVCKHYKISKEIIIGEDRDKLTCEARHLAIWLIRKYCKQRVVPIGALFNRDHTSIIHAIKKINSLIFSEPNFKEKIYYITSQF